MTKTNQEVYAELLEDIGIAELVLESFKEDLAKATTDEERERIERRIEQAEEEVNFLWSIELARQEGEEEEF